MLTIDTEKELRKALRRRAIQDARITTLNRIIVPRLKWSDRLVETYEQKKRITATMFRASTDKFDQKCNLKRILFIGNTQLDAQSLSQQTEAFILSYNVQE